MALTEGTADNYNDDYDYYYRYSKYMSGIYNKDDYDDNYME